MTPKLYYPHDIMTEDLNTMFRQMALDSYKPDVVVGVTRGGLVPAVYVSHYFEKPLVTLNVSFRDNNVQGSCAELIDLIRNNNKLLIVDDICDSGETLAWIYEQIHAFNIQYTKMVKTAALVHNQACQKFLPDYYGLEVNKAEEDVWVVFDWER